MDDVLECILGYIRWVHREPEVMADASTLAVVTELRARLDAACPEWRWVVYRENPDGCGTLDVEIVLNRDRSVRGVLVQRPSPVPGGEG